MNFKFRKISSSKGFTLIEIMISLLIGVFLIAGAIQIFINSKQTYRVQEALARLQESGRFAIDFLGRDVRMAGYRGCSSRVVTTQIKNNLVNSTSFFYEFNKPIDGYEASKTGSTWSPSLSSEITGITSPKPKTDVITIRRAGEDGVQITGANKTLHQLTLHRNTVPTLKTCDVVLVSDCTQTSVYQVSSYDNANKNILFQKGGCNSSSAGGNADDLNYAYLGGTLNKALTTVYYIKVKANNQPALYRLTNANFEEELVEGVEDMQISYGQDNNKDFVADSYVPANIATPDKIVSVRISLLLRTIDDNIASKQLSYRFDDQNVNADDRRIRRIFTATIALRNKLQ